MSLLHAVEVTPRAGTQLRRAAIWWAENRHDAVDAVLSDFEEAIELRSRQPGLGAKSATPRYPDLRRLYLRRVLYHIYYRVTPQKVMVLAFWHASRGSGPYL